MLATKERYLTDAEGTPVAVVLDLETYCQLLEALEDLEDTQAADAALADDPEGLPLDEAWADIDQEQAKMSTNLR